MEISAKNLNDLSTDKPSRLRRDFFWLTWSGIVSIANSLLVWIFMARMRDVDEVGRFAILMGLYALFFSIVSLGLMTYLVTEISRRREMFERAENSIRKFVSSASVFLLISGLVSSAVMTATGFLVSESWTVRISTLVLSLGLIPTGLVTLSEAAAICYGRARLVAAASTVENLLRTVVPLGLIWGGFDIFTICLSFAAVRFIALAVYVIIAREHVVRFVFSKLEFRRIAAVCPTFAGTIIFASINWQASLILLGYLSTESETAKYGAASRFLIPVSILMASYSSVIQPSVARHVEQLREKLGAYLSKTARIPLIVATLIAICSPFFSGWVLTLLFGPSYASASTALDILALSIIPFCLVIVAAGGLVATGSQRVDLFANILGAVVCFCAGIALIPRYGAVGAAAAQLLSFTSMALVEIVYLSRKINGFSVWRTASLSSASLIVIYMFLWKH